jgi:photosystem II stability/assembly factor-like uncharacterized protein
VAGAGDQLKLAVAHGGRHALATSAGTTGISVLSRWGRGTASGLSFGALAWSGDAAVWGIEASTGYLLSYRGGDWSVPGANPFDSKTRTRLLEMLGGRSLAQAEGADVGSGLHALAFGQDGQGYAVGDRGLVARYANGRWSTVGTAARKTLRAVATGGRGRAVAVGDAGTLLEASGKTWLHQLDTVALVGGQNLSSVDVLADGSALAATDRGALIQQHTAGKPWTFSPLPPLGVKIVKLRAYRAKSGRLHALALVRAGRGNALLLGDRDGWRSLGEPVGLAVADFDLDRGRSRLWLAGRRNGSASIVHFRPDGTGGWTVEEAKGQVTRSR